MTLRACYSVLSRAATCVHGRERASGETHSSAPKSAWSTGGKNESAMRQPVTPRTRYLAASVPFQPDLPTGRTAVVSTNSSWEIKKMQKTRARN